MKNLSQSLVKFHSQFKPIRKDAQNPFFKSDYLTLSGILDAVRSPLAANGLAVVQTMRVSEASTLLVTKLLHETGEELLCLFFKTPKKCDHSSHITSVTSFRHY